MSTSPTPLKRIQPGRGSKPKSLWDMCEECFLHHDPEEICTFAEDQYSEDEATAAPAKRTKNVEGKKSNNSDDDMAVREIAAPVKKAKTNSVGDGGKKRGTNVEVEEVDICECEGMDHETEAECEREQIRKKHVEVAFCIMLGSKSIVIIRVGIQGQPFHVCKELLALHSGYIRNLFLQFQKYYVGPLSYNISDIDISPLQFSLFLSWSQHGYFMEPLLSMSEDESNADLEHLWAVGHRLESPGFQNYIMECLRTSKEVQSGDWPTPDEARKVYHLTSNVQASGSGIGGGTHEMLRIFVADSIAANNPFERYDSDSNEYAEWLRLYTENTVISLDVHKASSKRWSESKPWEDQHRKSYLTEEKSIDERLEGMILESRTAHNIALAAGGGCIRSKLELEYLGDEDE